MEGIILSRKRNPEVGSLGLSWWPHEITRAPRLPSFYSAVFLTWLLEQPLGPFMARGGCWGCSHIICIPGIHEGKRVEELTSCLLRRLQRLRPAPSELVRISMWTHLPAKAAGICSFFPVGQAHFRGLLLGRRRDFGEAVSHLPQFWVFLHTFPVSVLLKPPQIVCGKRHR